MIKCKRIENCSFFNVKMKNMPITAQYFMQNYCEGDHSKCARNYLLAYLNKKDIVVDDKTEKIIAGLSDTLYPDQLQKVMKALPA